MATLTPFSTLLILSILTLTTTNHALYLSPKTIFPNYNNMLHSFKIFIYPTQPPPIFTTTQESHFYKSLLHSHFLTQDPTQAHLFFLPFSSSTSTRSIARVVKYIRLKFPFWNRTLGADHFYLSTAGVEPSSDRNIVELKKNSIQISCFPTISGLFIPHKDITLVPLPVPAKIDSYVNVTTATTTTTTTSFLGYMKVKHNEEQLVRGNLIEEIKQHPDFKVDYEYDQDIDKKGKFVKASKFCLFVYGSDMRWMVEAMSIRCVPVVITDRPIQDLPLMDVVDWSKMTVFVGSNGGVKGLKRVLDGIEKNVYEEMMESGVEAVQHLRWNVEAQPHDAFHMVVYQLWLRRHTIRYARWVEQ